MAASDERKCWHSVLWVRQFLCVWLPGPACPLQKDLLDACDIEVALVGHGMAQDQEQAELFEIEW
jgi:protein-disulfide isomerase-like protein with CxxC motif